MSGSEGWMEGKNGMKGEWREMEMKFRSEKKGKMKVRKEENGRNLGRILSIVLWWTCGRKELMDISKKREERMDG